MFERSQQGAVDLVRGDEPLNLERVMDASELLEACANRGQPRIVIDLKRVPLIDSAGLELLLDVRDRCLKRGGALKLAAPNHLCEDILRITDVAPQFEIFDDVVSAVGSFAQ